MDLQIRTIIESDIPAVYDIVTSLPGLASDRAAVHWLFPNFFGDTSFVATNGGTICGFALGFVSQTDPQEAYLYLLGVKQDSWGQDIGTRLIKKFSEAAKYKGCQSIILTTTPENERAQKFYLRAGFAEPELLSKVGQKRIKFRKIFVRFLFYPR